MEVLLAHRSLPAPALTHAMDAAIASGCLDPAAVVIEARRGNVSSVAPVIAIGSLARFEWIGPSLAGYDNLLTGARS